MSIVILNDDRDGLEHWIGTLKKSLDSQKETNLMEGIIPYYRTDYGATYLGDALE